MHRAIRPVARWSLSLLLCLPTALAGAQDPALPEAPPGSVSPDAPRVALVDSGVDYELDLINRALARTDDGSLIGYDFWDLDPLPYDAHPDARGRIQRHGTATASVLIREAPGIALVPYRYPRPDMSRMQALIEHAESHDVRIIGLPLGGNRKDQWLAFEAAARTHPQILFIASAGNNARDIDSQAVYPAALDLPNLLVVTSADDFGRVAQGVNWGRRSVDYLVPAEHVPVTRFGGQQGHAAGSSHAVPKVVALAARWWQVNPQWGVGDVLAAIRRVFADGSQPARIRAGYLHDSQFDPALSIRVEDVVHWQSRADATADLQVRNLPLDVLILDDRWSFDEVSRVLDEAQTILAQCGLHFTDVQLRRVAAPEYLRDLETGRARTLLNAVRLSGQQRRVTVLFARDTRMQQAFDAEAFGRANTRSRPWMSDTLWLTLALQDRGIALAHELFHVIANSGAHSRVPGNLMLARTTGSNRTLLAEQCLQLQALP